MKKRFEKQQRQLSCEIRLYFQTAKVEIPPSMIVTPLVKNCAAVTDEDGSALCILLSELIDSDVASLGAPPLSAVYAVFDLENSRFGMMAQAEVNESETTCSIEDIGPAEPLKEACAFAITDFGLIVS
ncbi:hypothetical protein CORC01_11586 [Colletotrichum orchidophilum]|uniref:Uncharacterized protein n=1 Tax=Colletotrichum orchidophilum TaxID=1209926 RepID=A0A1G4AVA5_9PEZI|nr:uncharacterized protein CORC01_11586 [Colletotrichum orchidophilum]OHE93097.1 hypothetical protein CORC01_11586 [Colletotrichum orchidophilum]